MHMLLMLCASLGAANAPSAAVSINCGEPVIPMGSTLKVEAQVDAGEGASSAVAYQLLPFVDGVRWGHHARADKAGKATFWIPMPRAGKHRLQVMCRAVAQDQPEFWIWPKAAQGIEGPVWMQRRMQLPEGVTLGASVWLAADDEARLFVNGQEVAHKTGWTENVPASVPGALLREGENVLSLWGNNIAGPAGLLLRMEFEPAGAAPPVYSNASWRAFASEPEGWPGKAGVDGAAPGEYGRAGGNAAKPKPWPGLDGIDLIYVEAANTLPPDAAVSNTLEITVEDRVVKRAHPAPRALVGLQWEPWFTRLNAWWTTAQGTPLLGFYDSSLRDITRQHVIWSIETGVDFLIGDWSNHIWFSKSWNDIGPGSWELINATTSALDELAAMRDEGHDVPKFTLLTGISHVAPPDGPRAVNEQLDWIYTHYVANPKYAGLWQEFNGKPLVLPLNLGASYLKAGHELDDRFCIRYMGAGTDHNNEAELGLWSWMDHQYPGAPTRDGVVESMTASVGSFATMGWLGDRARGRRNGATLVEDWSYVLQRRPRVVQLHQFNEFTGALDGQAHGHANDQYYDSYSIELSDDIEPVTLDQEAYRGNDGYGFYYLNLCRALVDLLHEEPMESTVLAIQRPTPARPGFSIKPVIRDDSLELIWTWAGIRPETATVTINGKTVLESTRAAWATISLADFAPGELRIRVTGNGSKTRYPLWWRKAAERLEEPTEAWAEVVCIYQPR